MILKLPLSSAFDWLSNTINSGITCHKFLSANLGCQTNFFYFRKSVTSFFAAYDALCEEGTATPVCKALDEVADISVPGKLLKSRLMLLQLYMI